MPEPGTKDSDKMMAEGILNQVKYHFSNDNDEDPDTFETRQSVKVAEKSLKHIFFINAREKKDFEADVANGRIDGKELAWATASDDYSELHEKHSSDSEVKGGKGGDGGGAVPGGADSVIDWVPTMKFRD